MPSFVCDSCQETLKKAKLDQHAQRCRHAAFSCIDCYKTFKGVEYRDHFSCITEVQKYHQKGPVTPKQEQSKKPSHVTSTATTSTATPTTTTNNNKIIDSELTKSIKQFLKSTPSADFKIIKKELKKKLGKKSKKTLQNKIIFSLNKDTNELVLKLEN